MSYNNLGNVYSDTGDLEKAKEYHEWALKIQKEQLGVVYRVGVLAQAERLAPPMTSSFLNLFRITLIYSWVSCDVIYLSGGQR